MNTILCIGQAVFDITFPVETFIRENEKYRIYDRLECMGAPAANAAYLCALWGAHTSLIARIGSDVFGNEIVTKLQQVGVDTSCMYIDDKNPTSLSCIIANKENGNRTILNSSMRECAFPIQFPTEIPDVILVDGHELNASLQALERYPNARSIIDAGTYKEYLIPLIKKVDYLVCSQAFAYEYTKTKICITDKKSWAHTFQKLEELNSKTIVVTLGDQGVLYKEDNQIHHLPAFQVPALDTTGAGDIFHGAFTYCLCNGYSLKETIMYASLSAAISVQTLGAQTSIPTKDTVWKQYEAIVQHTK